MTASMTELAHGWDYLTDRDWRVAISGQRDPFQFEQCGVMYARAIAEVLPKRIDTKILEIGPGCGRIMKYLSSMCEEIHGVDVSPKMVDLSKKYLENFPNAEVHLIEDESLDLFEDDTFDFAYAIGCFIHCEPEMTFKYLESLKRVMRPGSLVYCDMHALESSADATTLAVRSNRVVETTPAEVVRMGDMFSHADIRTVRSRYVCKFTV
jgi:ubiquinone/menaquinone biosynthesis C-methylase UbiE|tara:strand:+ start:5772 stop:6398 length:627 start_codon:yes stop_codon:yes gene_type:complete